MCRITVLLLSMLFLFSCDEKKSDKNFVLTGNIKGLKDGVVYIQRIKDTSFIVIDSIKISGNSNFISEFDLDSPEMLYLFLDRGISNSLDNNIPFFAEQGKMNIETSLDFFTADAEITGSKNHELYEEYKKVMSRYIDQELELVKKRLVAFRENKESEITEIDKQQDNILKRKYLYTTNFAVNYADNEIAPYVALAEIYDVNLKYLDTIQKTMSPKVAKSLYGKKLTEYYNERKKLEE